MNSILRLIQISNHQYNAVSSYDLAHIVTLALLFRKWKNRVKGRDWYDLEWYIRKGIPLNINHFLHRATETGDWKKESIRKEDILVLLQEKIDSVSFDSIKDDVRKFIRNDEQLKIWNASYFKDLVRLMNFID